MKTWKALLVVTVFMAFFSGGAFLPALGWAGDLEPPESAVDEMGNPVSTMHTLSQIYQKPVWRIIGLDFKDWPNNSRFKVSYEGSNWTDVVLDKETGLMWARDANLAKTRNYLNDGQMLWANAIVFCNNVGIGQRQGWRLPTTAEMSSLLDISQTGPALPSGHPFVNVQALSWYWSSTIDASQTTHAGCVGMENGLASNLSRISILYVWPVRGGQ